MQELHNKAIEFLIDIKDITDKQKWTSDSKIKLFMPLFQISYEHGLAILKLIDKKVNLNASAYALVRPMIESLLRALWIKYCASSKELEEISFGKSKAFPGISKILEKVENKVSYIKGNNLFSETIKPLITNLHDYTHGGVQSIARTYNKDGNKITNLRNDNELEELIRLVIFLSYLNFIETCEYTETSFEQKKFDTNFKEIIDLSSIN